MAQKPTLTKRYIESLPIPVEKRAQYIDSDTKGFGLMIQPTGKKTFYWYRKVAGYPTYISIGEHPSLSVEAARGVAEEYNGKLARWKSTGYAGRSPFDRGQESDLTVAKLIDFYIEKHIRLDCKNPDQAVKTAEWVRKKYLPESLKARKPEHFRREHVKELLSEIRTKHGDYTRNRVLQFLRAAFKFAITEELFTGESPCAGIAELYEEERDRRLEPEELPAFFKALASEETPDHIRDIVLVALFTGSRSSKVFGLKWDDVNLERGVWRVENPKGKKQTSSGETKPYFSALSPEVVAILTRRKDTATSQYVFPSTKAGKPHIVDIKAQWRSLLKRAGITNLRVHDLRRSLGSFAADDNTSLLVIGKMLGHASTAATHIYARLSLGPVREATERTVNTMLEAGGVSRKLLGAGTGD